MLSNLTRRVFYDHLSGALAALVLCLTIVSPCLAANPGYQLEVFQGPVVSSQRVVGMGGAYIGLAEGVAGHLDNPAAFAVRSVFSGNPKLDWDFGFAIFDVIGNDTDLEMSGRGGEFADAGVFQGGANIKLGRLGFGLHLGQTTFDLPVKAKNTDGDLVVQMKGDEPLLYAWKQRTFGLGLAWAFFDGEWVLGTIVGWANAIMANGQTEQSLQMSSSVGLDNWGLLWAPRSAPWRLGLNLKLPVTMTQENSSAFGGDFVNDLGNLVVPAAVNIPWSVGVGGAYSIWGERPLNVRPAYGTKPIPADSVADDKVPRRYLLVTADLVLTGATDEGIGVQGWLEQEVDRAGRAWTLSARAGAEGEVIPDWLILRAGSYFEPSRFEGRLGRLHGTAGFDVKVPLPLERLGVDVGMETDLQLTGVADVADGYWNMAIGFGLWR